MYCLMDVKWNSLCYVGVLALLQDLGRKTKQCKGTRKTWC